MPLLIHLVLGEDAPKISLAAFGGAIALFSAPPFQLFRDHGHSRTVGAHIHDRSIAGTGVGWTLLPFLRTLPHALDHALNLPGRDGDAAGLGQVPLGFEIGRFIRPFQANKFSQGWRVTHLQAQRGIGWIVALLFALVIVVSAEQIEAAKNPLHPKGFPAFEDLSGFGLVGRVDPIDGLLQHPAEQFVAALE